jgi:long-chain acyl-CoA synthetase
MDNLGKFAQQTGIPFEKPEDLLDDDRVYKLMMDEIDARVCPKRGFKLFERINKIALLSRPFEKGTEMTHTLKLKRDVISSLYGKQIVEMFRERR